MKILLAIWIAVIISGVACIGYMSHEMNVMAQSIKVEQTEPLSDLTVTQSTDSWGNTSLPLQGTQNPQPASTEKIQGN